MYLCACVLTQNLLKHLCACVRIKLLKIKKPAESDITHAAGFASCNLGIYCCLNYLSPNS